MVYELTDTGKAACLFRETGGNDRPLLPAEAACSDLILRCLGEGLYPSRDAQNMASVHLAEKPGYELDHTYTVYEISQRQTEKG